MWPLSAFRDFKKKKDRDAEIRERDKWIDQLIDSVEESDPKKHGNALCMLAKYASEPLMLPVALATIDRMAKSSMANGIHDAIYIMNCWHDKELKEAVGEKILSLAKQADPSNEKLMASIAMAANMVALETDGDLRKKGEKLWHDTVDTLSKIDSGIQFAFAAASNAVLGHRNVQGPVDYPLREEALDKWYRMVVDLAKTDHTAAYTEARRVAAGYEAFGDEAKPFRKKAAEAMNKLAFGGQ